MTKKLSIAAFWEVLAKAKNKFYKTTNGIRTEDGTCPVCYVCNKVKKTDLVCDYWEATSQLELPYHFCSSVAHAADSFKGKYSKKLKTVLGIK